MTPDAAVETRRDGAVRREIRRGGARRRDGRAARATRRPSRSSCAAARMCGAPATSAISGSVGESAVAAGVRRIEAVTGASAEAVVAEIAAPAERRRRRAARRPGRGRRSASPRCWRTAASWSAQVADLQKKLATGGGGAGGRGGRRRASSPRATWARCRRAT